MSDTITADTITAALDYAAAASAVSLDKLTSALAPTDTKMCVEVICALWDVRELATLLLSMPTQESYTLRYAAEKAIYAHLRAAVQA
jgi:hypothetical protein